MVSGVVFGIPRELAAWRRTAIDRAAGVTEQSHGDAVLQQQTVVAAPQGR